MVRIKFDFGCGDIEIDRKEILTYLRKVFIELNNKFFSNKLSDVEIEIAHGPIGSLNKGVFIKAAGLYKEKESNQPAIIYINPDRLFDGDEEVRQLILHEMIHHWEELDTYIKEKFNYPHWLDEAIIIALGKEAELFRNGHSKKFLAKAYSITQDNLFYLKLLHPKLEKFFQSRNWTDFVYKWGIYDLPF